MTNGPRDRHDRAAPPRHRAGSGSSLSASDADRFTPPKRLPTRGKKTTDASHGSLMAALDDIGDRQMASPGKSGRRRTKGRRSAPSGGIGRLLRRALYWAVVLGLWGGIGAFAVLAYVFFTLPKIDDWKVPDRPPNVQIVDASGDLIANRGDTGGEQVPLDAMSPFLPKAVIAIEDRRFYSHFGIDPIGLVRALVTNATSGGVVQGGSTLTQQLAKNLFLQPDRTIERKLQEVVLALWLEWRFSKNDILEMYLNRVYLGAGTYGVDAAAHRYFGKSAHDLDLAEAATIAGLLKAPSRYAPTNSPKLAAERANVVLGAMVDEGYISRADAAAAHEVGAPVARSATSASANYVADWIMDLLPGYLSHVRSDVVVVTTIDMSMQRAAEAALRTTLDKEGAKFQASQGALVSIGNDGAVKALVGGRDYGASQFNRAIEARRQPGSSFKPFVYLTAIEHGFTPQSIVVDEPVSINGWKPRNYEGKYLGPVTLTTALAQSLNTVAARLAADVGPANVVRTARRLGIVSTLHDNPSIALGTAEVTPLEITAAYVPFANGGNGIIPYVIDEIRTAKGDVLFRRSGSGPGRVIEPRVVGTMNSMLSAVVLEGTGQKARLPGRQVAGKTGTSQDFRDAWFIGFVDGLTTGVWLGNDDNAPTRKATGGALTALLWNRYMTDAAARLPVKPLPGLDLVAPAPAPEQAALPPPDGQLAPPLDLPEATGSIPDAPTPRERNLLEMLFGN